MSFWLVAVGLCFVFGVLAALGLGTGLSTFFVGAVVVFWFSLLGPGLEVSWEGGVEEFVAGFACVGGSFAEAVSFVLPVSVKRCPPNSFSNVIVLVGFVFVHIISFILAVLFVRVSSISLSCLSGVEERVKCVMVISRLVYIPYQTIEQVVFRVITPVVCWIARWMVLAFSFKKESYECGLPALNTFMIW